DAIELEIDSCTQCGGLWFDAHELASFLHSDPLKERFLWVDREPPHMGGAHPLDIVPRNCPRDKMVLQQKIFAGITLDRCPQCEGLWFDGGEVRLVVERYQAHP